MDRIDNMTFKSSRQMGLWYAHEDLEQIKASVSRHLQVKHERLHAIALEDIEIERQSQVRIYDALYELAVMAEIGGQHDFTGTESPGVPCTGFWIEGPGDLILYAWNNYRSRTIVVPRSEWFLREDIVIH